MVYLDYLFLSILTILLEYPIVNCVVSESVLF